MTHGVRGPVVTVTAAVMLLVATACGRQEITSYSVPKEETGPPPPAAAPHRGSAPSAPQLRWEVPAGWEEQAAGGHEHSGDAELLVPGGRLVREARDLVGLERLGETADILDPF